MLALVTGPSPENQTLSAVGTEERVRATDGPCTSKYVVVGD